MKKNYPVISGTFLQPGFFNDYDDKKWDTHLKYLKEVGIDKVIIQWSANTPNLKFTYTAYPSILASENKLAEFQYGGEYVVEGCLKAAQTNGMKVFVGLNEAPEWWSKYAYDEKWNTSQALLGNKIAKEIYDLYKSKYPEAFYGWYYVWEMFNSMNGCEKACADMMNVNLDFLTELDPSMPLMLSPFVRAAEGDAVSAGLEWDRLFSMTNFRKGDIYCSQDAVGAGWMKIDLLDDYFREITKAIDKKDGLLFWANNENFTDTDIVPDSPKTGTRFIPAPLDRFVRQMEISDKYVSDHVTFAYSHYYSPDRCDPKLHEAYKQYFETGKTE
ncbi:MAG: hypothetical protein A2Y17_03305 [Clostridiales bacterium GWF2_38_85]|nr:MAG: hypothetical protein A2Y17_03305 [Clostridiales bacterium GWF2_38_85]HBL85234.1 hypothetical protein [Clostridiales bacterium]